MCQTSKLVRIFAMEDEDVLDLPLNQPALPIKGIHLFDPEELPKASARRVATINKLCQFIVQDILVRLLLIRNAHRKRLGPDAVAAALVTYCKGTTLATRARAIDSSRVDLFALEQLCDAVLDAIFAEDRRLERAALALIANVLEMVVVAIEDRSKSRARTSSSNFAAANVLAIAKGRRRLSKRLPH
jgi:hypothetical protein